jgi:hypothetical protein
MVPLAEVAASKGNKNESYPATIYSKISQTVCNAILHILYMAFHNVLSDYKHL